MSSPGLFEIVALSTLLSGQSFGQEIPGILLSPDFSPHALRQDGNNLPNSGGLSSSFRAITPQKHADLPLAMAMGGCTEGLDGSGAVDFSDLLEILSSFGACP